MHSDHTKLSKLYLPGVLYPPIISVCIWNSHLWVMVIPLAPWNASITHEVQWIIPVMEMCCRRYGACQSCFSSAFLGQLELVFPTISLERIVLNGLGLNIPCSALRVKKKFKYKLHLQS